MSRFARIGATLALASIAAIAGQSAANAHRVHHRYHHHHHSAGAVCKARVEGRATGQGLFGAGTEAARSAAQTDWESKVATSYGEKFASLAKASLVRWDCSKNAILKAKCVVTARPCG